MDWASAMHHMGMWVSADQDLPNGLHLFINDPKNQRTNEPRAFILPLRPNEFKSKRSIKSHE